MTYDSLSISEVIPASPDRISAAWLSSAEHSAFTGDKATVEPYVGGKHSSFDGYAVGRTIELQPGRRIVQTWRAEDFPGFQRRMAGQIGVPGFNHGWSKLDQAVAPKGLVGRQSVSVAERHKRAVQSVQSCVTHSVAIAGNQERVANMRPAALNPGLFG